MINVVLEFFTTGWILPNFNANSIFGNSEAKFIPCFVESIWSGNAFIDEQVDVKRAIEIAYHNLWYNLCIQTNSSLVVLAFKYDAIVPCSARNRWENCMHDVIDMHEFDSFPNIYGR